MSKYPFFLRRMALPLAALLGVALTTTPQTALLGGEPARLDGFTQADGSSVFALTLKPSAPPRVERERRNPRQHRRQPGGRLSRQGAGHAPGGAREARTERPRQARGLRPRRRAADPGLRGPQQPSDGRGAEDAQAARPAGRLRSANGPRHGRKEFHGRQQVAQGRPLCRRRQQSCQRAFARTVRPRGQRSAGPAGPGHRLWHRSSNPRADARGPGLPHRGRRGGGTGRRGRRRLRRPPGPGRAWRGPLAKSCRRREVAPRA